MFVVETKTQTTMKEFVFVVVEKAEKAEKAEKGYIFHGVFSTKENAKEGARNHDGAFVMIVKLNEVVGF